MNIEIIKLNHTGFCYGVKRSITLLDDYIKLREDKITLLGDIVHNKTVNDYFKAQNIKILSGNDKHLLLSQINLGTVVITAHGVSDKIKEKILERGLTLLDATCPHVNKSYARAKDEILKGNIVFFIGKNNHPESIALLDFEKNIYIIDNEIPTNLSGPIKVMSQTTMSKYDVLTTFKKINNLYPDAELINSTCHETDLRQKELQLYLDKVTNDTFFIVIGDFISNNTTKLFETIKRQTNNCALILDEDHLDLNILHGFKKVVITSGTSCSIKTVNEIIKKIKNG